MANSSKYSVQDLCAIIKTCRENGVVRAKLGELSIDFLPEEPKILTVATPEQQKQEKLAFDAALAENEARIKLDYLANLRLSNPEEFEDLVARGELENARQESDGVDA